MKTMNEQEMRRQFEAEHQKTRQKNFKRPNILVIGYTGAGKTSLIQTILGNDLVPESKIGSGKPVTQGYEYFENELIRLWDSKGFELGHTEAEFMENTRRFLRERQNDPDVDNHIHLIWYLIQGPSARVTDCDRSLIQNILPKNRTLVAISKVDITRPQQEAAIREIVESCGIPASQIFAVSDAQARSIGVRELVARSYEMLPDAYRAAFVDAQIVDREMKIAEIRSRKGKASAIISTATAAAAAIGATPIPVSDAPILMGVQVSLIGSLAALYDLPKEGLKQLAYPLLLRMVGIYTASSLLKLFPFLGSAINAAVAGTLTGALGWYVANKFEKAAIARIESNSQYYIDNIDFDIDEFMNFKNQYEKEQGR